MKNQNFEVSCEVLSEIELQETIGGGVLNWLTGCFKPQRVTPLQTYSLPEGGTVEAVAGIRQEVFRVT